MKIRLNKEKDLQLEEETDYMDDVYGMKELRRLTRGVLEEMEESGELPEGIELDVDEVIDEVVVSDDQKYSKTKKIQHLDRLINARIQKVKELDRVIQGKQCRKPSTDDLLRFCNTVQKVSKGQALKTDK